MACLVCREYKWKKRPSIETKLSPSQLLAPVKPKTSEGVSVQRERMISVFSENKEGIRTASIYLYSLNDNLFVSESSPELIQYLVIDKNRTIKTVLQDPDLLPSLTCICGLKNQSEQFQFELKLKKSFERLKSFELISGKAVRLDFELSSNQFKNRYEINVENDDICENYIISKFLHYKTVCCKECSQIITRLDTSNPPYQIQKMPKEDWKELLDCWSCHNDEFGYYAGLEQKFKQNVIYIGMDYVIFGDGILNEPCSHIPQIGSSVPITTLQFEDAAEKFIFNPTQLMILRLVYWTNSTSTFHFYLSTKEFNVLVWVLSSVSNVAYNSNLLFNKSLKILWKKLAIGAEFNRIEYQNLDGIPEQDVHFIFGELERTNQKLPECIQKIPDNFNVSFLSLE